MMTEQELSNLLREARRPSIPSIVQELIRLSQTLEKKAGELASLHAASSKNGEDRVQH